MHLRIKLFIGLMTLLPFAATAAERLAEETVAIQLLESVDVVTVFSPMGFTVSDAQNSYPLPAGLYEFSRQTTTPPIQQFHLFSKTFTLPQAEAEEAYIESWKQRGYPAQSVTIGKKLTTSRDRVLDARINWISIAQASSKQEAERKQNELEAAEQWTWMRPETVTAGTGTVKLTGPKGSYSLQLPITLTSSKALSVANVNVGFWDERLKNLAYEGRLELTISPKGGLELLEHSTVEEYLRGVLPSEMPALWPEEALKAQAVSARSEVLVNLSTKHSLENFDFCNKEHCRAYHGINRNAEQTDRALSQTRGEILVQNEMIVPTVFSANCGGWTANNDSIWFGPPNAALRAVQDTPNQSQSNLQSTQAVKKWLSSSSEAFCKGDPTGFRWTQDYSESEIHAMIGKNVTVGRIERIELGERGVGGRLKWIRIHGSTNTVVIKKELPIRQALGGLPSAMFDLSVWKSVV